MSTDSDITDTSSEDEQQQATVEQVTGANADPQVLQCFWDLASLDQETRQAAATSLVKAMVDNQKQHDASLRPENAQPGGSLDQEGGNRQQRLESCLTCCSPLMAYGLKRLARGLASSRQGARQGFAAALAAVLAHSAAAAEAVHDQSSNKTGAVAGSTPLQLPFLSAAGVLALLEACLEVTGSMKGSEQRDALLGRVFGLAALARSGLVTVLPEAPAGSAAAHRGLAAVADQLVGLLQRKAFLRESAAAALVELLSHVDSKQMQQVAAHAPKLVAFLQIPLASATPESLFIALRLWHNMPAQQLQNCQLLPALPVGATPPPELFWQQPGAVQRSSVAAAAAAVFAAGHLKGLCSALLATTASHPRLHPVWGCMLALLVPGFVPVKVLQPEADQEQQQQSRAAPDAQQLANLWQHFVENCCLNSSHERKALAVQLLQLLLPVLTPESVPVLLSKPMLGCLSTAVRNKDSYLHSSACRCMDRINSCAEHNLIAKADPALSAKLRLALAAQLSSANLQQAAAAAGASKPKGPAGLLQGLDAAGVAAYVDQLLGEFVAAVKQAAGAANGAGGEASSDDEEMPDADVDGGKVRQLLDQLAAALRIPAADNTTLSKGLTFLAAAAFLQLPAGLSATALAAADSAAAAAATPAGKPGKKQKGSKSSSSSGQEGLQLEKQVLELAAQMQPQPPQQVRKQCAAKLVMLLHSLQNRTVSTHSKQDTHKQQQQQQQDTDGEAAAAAVAESKAQKKARQQAEREQAAAAARQAAGQQQSAITARLLKLVTAAQQQLNGVQLTADEDVQEMVEQLQTLEAAVVQHAQRQQQQQSKAEGAAAVRSRVVLLLVHQLQLQLLSGGLTAEAAGSFVDDLEVAVVKGLGMSIKGLGMDAAAVAAAAAASAGNSGSSENDEEAREDDSDDDSEDGEPAWQDVLLDLLIALLSNSSSVDAAKGGDVLIPTAPLREACEAVFRAFAEDITAQGLSDMLRVLSQRASEVSKKWDDEDDEVEMDVDQSGDEEDQSDVSDQSDQEDQQAESEDTSEDEREDDQPSAAAAAPAAAAKTQLPAAAAAAAAAAAGSEEDEESGSDLDDDAMMRMEAQLGAAVRSMLNRGGGSAKERAAALLGLQLRVAALLEEWLKKCSKSPLVLQVVLPLLKALVAARGAGGNPTLADRLASIVNKQLSKCRPALVLPPAQQDDEAVQPPPQQQQQHNTAAFEADVRKVLYYASREKDPRIAAAAAQALLVLLHAGEDAAETAAAASVQAAAAAALNDFFEKKKSRLQKQWCEQLLSRCPRAALGGDAAALQALLTACSKGRNESVRGQAAALLPVLVRSPQQGLLLPALQKHQGLVAAALGAAVAGPYKNKELHAAAVKAVVGLLAGVGKLSSGKRLAETLGSEAVRELGKVVVVVKAAGVAPRVETQLDRLVEVAGLQQLVAAGSADPARLALLKKQRAALEGKAAAGHGKGHQQQQGGQVEGSGQEQQKSEKKANKSRKQQQSEEAAAAAAAGDGKKQKMKKDKQQQQDSKPAAAAAAAASPGKRKKEKDDGKGKKKKHKTDKR